MKKILLTGASGFIGKQVLDSLLKKDVSIKLVVREDKGHVFKKNPKILDLVETKDFFAESSDWYENICKDIDLIIHLAWYAEPGKYLESPLNLECLSGSLKFAKAASNQPIKKFVGAGTCFEYDLTNNMVLDANAELNPKFLYSITKAAAFNTLSKLFKNSQIDFLWTRIFYLFGEGEDERRLVPVIRNKLSKNEIVDLTSGEQIRDFMDVKQAGDLIANASLGLNTGAFNVCSGKGISIKDLAIKIADEYGKRDLLNFGAIEDNLNDAQFIVGKRNEILG